MTPTINNVHKNSKCMHTSKGLEVNWIIEKKPEKKIWKKPPVLCLNFDFVSVF